MDLFKYSCGVSSLRVRRERLCAIRLLESDRRQAQADMLNQKSTLMVLMHSSPQN